MCRLETSGGLTRARGTKICLEIPFSEYLYHIEVFTETYFQIDYSTFIDVLRYIFKILKMVTIINTLTLKEHHLSTP